MEYVKLIDIMNEVRGILEEGDLFEQVSKAAITSRENLFEAMPYLASFPAAIVNCPPATFPTPGAWRELALEIIIVDKFHGMDMEAAADSACRLIDGVVSRLTPSVPGQTKKLACGANLSIEDIMALALDSQHTAWLIETRIVSKII